MANPGLFSFFFVLVSLNNCSLNSSYSNGNKIVCWCAWDLNAGPQDGRRSRNHGDMATSWSDMFRGHEWFTIVHVSHMLQSTTLVNVVLTYEKKYFLTSNLRSFIKWKDYASRSRSLFCAQKSFKNLVFCFKTFQILVLAMLGLGLLHLCATLGALAPPQKKRASHWRKNLTLATSVTRLGDFWKFLVPWFLSMVKIFANVKGNTFHIKLLCLLFGQILENFGPLVNLASCHPARDGLFARFCDDTFTLHFSQSL